MSIVTIAAGLTLASLSSIVSGAGNPIPTSSAFYVSPTGDDAANGDLGSPLATLGKATELAITWIHQSDGSGNYPNNAAEIILRGGRHALVSPASNPLAPGLEISGAATRPGATITFRNYTNETAVIHGAIEFVAENSPDRGSWQTVANLKVYNGGTTTTATPAGMKLVTVQKYIFSGALRAQLAERIANLRAARVNGGKFCFTEMYVNDVRKTRARHPNLRAISADTSKFTVSVANVEAGRQLELAQPIVRFNSRWLEETVGGANNDIPLLNDPHTELVFTRGWQWARGIITEWPIVAFSDVPRLVARIGAMDNPPLHNPPADIHDYTYDEGQLAEINAITSINLATPTSLETWNRCRLENNKLFVDQPGEWFFDDDEIALYYYAASGEPITTQKFQFPVTYRLVALTGRDSDPVTGVQFIGQGTGNVNASSTYWLQFEKSAWKYDNGRGNSEFYSARHAGYVQAGAIDGVHVDGFKVAYCKFSQFGATAISLGGNRMWSNGHVDRRNYDNQIRGEVKNVEIDNNYVTDGGGTGIRVEHYPNISNQRSVLDYFWFGDGITPMSAPFHSSHVGITPTTGVPQPASYDLMFQFRPRDFNPTTMYDVLVTPTDEPANVLYENPEVTGTITVDLQLRGSYNVELATFCPQVYFKRVLSTDGTAPLDNNKITSNSITWIGKNFADGVGIHVAHATNTSINNNSISDVPFNGINVGYGCFRTTNERMQIRLNGVSRAMRKLIDGAGIYTGGGRSTVIANNTMVSIGATRDVDAIDASSNPRLINDLYFDLSSRAFTVSENAASEIYADQELHTFINQGGTIHPLALDSNIPCPDNPNVWDPIPCCGN
jgi:hypothetical protein